MMKALLTTATVLAGLTAAPALAQNNSTTLTINGEVAGYCSVRLGNVSSGTASVAFADNQEVANLEVACNQPSGTKFTVTGQNSDLKSSSGGRINYAFRIDSPQETAFNIGPTDFDLADNSESRSRTGYSQAVANGVALKMLLNVNRNNEGGSQGPDTNGQSQLPANNMPAGTYTEVFTFQVSAI